MKINTSIGKIKASKKTLIRLSNILLDAVEMNKLFNKNDLAKEYLEVMYEISEELYESGAFDKDYEV